nr:hypothetical protein [Tanacetum cinerariifolium]
MPKEDLMMSIQTFLEEFHCIPLEEKPTILLQAWFKFFAIKHDQPENLNELFQKLLKDLKELAEYKESIDNSSKEIATSSSNQEKEGPQDSDIRQLIREECCIEVSEEQKLNMENTILELVKICQEKELFCMHDNVDDLIEKETEHSLSMGYEHFRTTPETESDKVTESSAKNLLPIQSECEVTSEDKNNDDLDSSDDESLSEEDVPIEESKVFSNLLFNDDEINYDELESHVESYFVESPSNHDALIDSSQKIDYLEDFFDELAYIDLEIPESDFDFEQEIHLIENLLYDNSSPQPPEEHIAEEERIKREHDEYLSRMEMLFTINPRPRPMVNAIRVSNIFPREIDVVDDLRIDNSILNSEHEYFDDEESNLDNPSVPLLPLESPDEELDAGDEISVVRNTIVEFEYLYSRVELDVSNDENDDYSSFMFVIYSKVFSFLLSTESEDMIFDPGISV